MGEHDILLIAGIIGLGMFCQWLAWRLRIPAILPLLAAGFLVGPVTGILDPRELLGELFYPVVSLAVAIILFEGALTLKWEEVRNVVKTVRNLITIGALITWIGGAVAAHFIVGLDWGLATLFGALIVVTGPTVIAPLLRNVRPTQKVASVLRWEGVLIDPLGALLAVLVFDFIVAEGAQGELGVHAVVGFLRIVLVGTSFGAAAGVFVAFLLRRYLIPDYLRDVTVLAIVTLIFSISNYFEAESGLLAVTVMGVLLANIGLSQLHHIWHFKEKLSILLISSLFIILAANFTTEQLSLLDWRSFAVLAVVIFLIRPVGVLVSTAGSTLNQNERLFLSWIAPRGIVAAAVSSLFGFELLSMGYADAGILAPLTFLVIVGTVVLQAGTAKPIARWLDVAEEEAHGFLLLGAQQFSRMFAQALQDEEFTVRLIDMNRSNVREARLQGLDAYYGNVLSETSETTVDLSGIGQLLALTSNDEANAIACLHMQDELGSSNVFQLPPHSLGKERRSPSPVRLGRLLFDERATCEQLTELMHAGATLKKTRLTEQFTYADYLIEYGDNFIPMLAFKGNQVTIATLDTQFEPKPGWTLMSFVIEPAAGDAVSDDGVGAETATVPADSVVSDRIS